MLFSDFKLETITLNGLDFRVRYGGKGPPLILLHGYPQTHFMWHKVAERLKEHFFLIMPDLRGYGGSDKPNSDETHAPYSKRAMASDIIALGDHFKAERFYLCGHDRGGRVAHRLAYDFPKRVKKLMTLDIAPTKEMYEATGERFAHGYWHWFFLTLKSPFPEKMIGADPKAFWLKKCGSGSAGLSPFHEEALNDYLSHFSPQTIFASCEDYRAAATLDLLHDRQETQLLETPLHVLWGANGVVNQCFDVLNLWRTRAQNVTGKALDSGHYMAEEIPDKVVDEIKTFFV